MRRDLLLGAVLVLGLAATAWSVPVRADVDPKGKIEEDLTPARLVGLLGTRITLEKGIDVGTPLSEALECLSDKSGVPIELNDRAFKQLDPAFNVAEQPIKLGVVKKQRLEAVLNRLLQQVRMEAVGGCQAVLLVRADHIEVTTAYHALRELVGTEGPREPEPVPSKEGAPVAFEDAANAVVRELRAAGSSRRLALPIVHLHYEDSAWSKAVAELANQHAVTVLVDPKVVKVTEGTTVNFTMPNVLFDTALEYLADLNGLAVVRIDGTFLITSPGNAEEIRKRRPAHRNEGVPAGLNPTTGGGA